LINDSQFHRQMQNNSIKRGELFDWKTTAEKTLNVYNEILQ
jgi:glycosyltransferase involved in cell wall biosynthesis